MNDEQRETMIQNQRTAMSYGEITYDRGLDLATITGWYGILDMAPPMMGQPSIFPMPQSRSVAMCVIVIQDIDTLISDQETKMIPFARVIDIRSAADVF